MGEGAPALDLAITRFKQGKCPCCGKGARESRGMEYRSKSEDLYCHTCKRRWPLELDIEGLQKEFATTPAVKKVATTPGVKKVVAAPVATAGVSPDVLPKRAFPIAFPRGFPRRLVAYIRQNILGR